MIIGSNRFSVARCVASAVTATLWLLGCSTPVTQPLPSASPEAASVYVYSPVSSGYARGMEILAVGGVAIYVDDQRACTVSGDNVARIDLAPGHHSIKGRVTVYGLPGPSLTDFALELKSGDSEYFRIEARAGDPSFFGMPYVMHYMTRVSRQEAEAVIPKLREIRCKPD